MVKHGLVRVIGTAIAAMAVLFVGACAPTAAPIPATSTPVTTPTSNLSLPTSQSPTSQDAAWNKIVEAARKEGKLTNYSYNFVGDIGIAVSRAFKEKYGINMEIITGTTAPFMERLRMEKRTGNPVADVIDGNASGVTNMKKEGLTASVGDDLPSLREKNVWVADVLGLDPQDKHLVIFNFSTYAAWVNTNQVKPGQEPKIWRDLLDPKWKGQMLFSDYMTSSAPYEMIVALQREKVIDENFLKELYKQDIKFTTAAPEEGLLLSRGERTLSIRGPDIVYGRFLGEGAPIRAVALSDGTVLAGVTTAAFKDGPHPNASRVFLNWFLSPEGQTVYGRAAKVASVRKDVPNFLPQGAQVTLPKPIILTVADTQEAIKRYTERWLNNLWGR